MQNYDKIDQFIETHMDNSIEELSRLSAQPSIAAQKLGLQECAQLVSEILEARGFEVKVMPTKGAPVVYAERKGKSDKTLIVYNHYDVQPPEPLELWESPPFEPTLREGKLYARGVSDDKGHITCRLHAIDAILEADGELPCNIKFLIEGEEEVGSVSLPEFIAENKDLLAADVCVWEFGGVNPDDIPIQYLGMRGICYVELFVETASIDAHSGLGGSIFPNAAWRLVWALRSLKGSDERIRIPGFYDPVVPPTERDRELMALLPDMGEEYRTRYGLKGFISGVEDGVELRIQEVFQPTCTICGLNAGYQGEGSKTVLPARASAKVDFRLVPNQTPKQVLEQLRAHLDDEGFEDVAFTFLGGEPPGRTDPDDPFVKLVVETAEPVYGMPMLIMPMIGGSGPNHTFLHHLKVPIVTAGVGYPGTQAHAPNENVRLDLYQKHAKHFARILKEYGK